MQVVTYFIVKILNLDNRVMIFYRLPGSVPIYPKKVATLSGWTALTGIIPTGIQVRPSSTQQIICYLLDSLTWQRNHTGWEAVSGAVTTVCTWEPTWRTWAGGEMDLVSGSGPLWTVSVRSRTEQIFT